MEAEAETDSPFPGSLLHAAESIRASENDNERSSIAARQFRLYVFERLNLVPAWFALIVTTDPLRCYHYERVISTVLG